MERIRISIRTEPILIALLLILLGPAKGRAQVPGIIQLGSSGTPHGLLSQQTSRPGEHLEIYAGLATQYAGSELEIYDPHGTTGAASFPIRHRATMELVVGLGLWRRLDLALAMPFYLSQAAEDYPAAGSGGSESGVGDLRITPKVVVLSNERFGGFGLAALLDLTVPTSTGASFMGESGASLNARLVLDYRFREWFVVAANAGYKYRKGAEVAGIPVDDEVWFGLGAEVFLPWQGLSVLLEAASGYFMGAETSNLSNPADTGSVYPLEMLGGVRWRHKSGLTLTAGGCRGLSQAMGVADSRAFLTVGYAITLGSKAEETPAEVEPVAEAKPAPAEPNAPRKTSPPPVKDEAVIRAETAAEGEKSGLAAATLDLTLPIAALTAARETGPAPDARAGEKVLAKPAEAPASAEPEEASTGEMEMPAWASEEPVKEGPTPPGPAAVIPVSEESKMSWGSRVPGMEPPKSASALRRTGGEEEIPPDLFDKAVAFDPDPDGDGIPMAADKCPHHPEDWDKFEDDNGCPDPDNDGDGIPDETDRCPNEKETINGTEDEDGCPDQGSSQVVIDGDKLRISEKIFFEEGSDRILAKSHKILEQIALVLQAAWQIRKLSIEGHTDDQGDPEMNVDLSERRARAVRAFLMDKRVAAHRLEAKGWGPSKPLADNKTPEGRASNRRVEFNIVEVFAPGGGQ